jgi:hypothetical protein
MLATRNVDTEDLSKVVWLLDPSFRPELEVEIEISYQPGELPGIHYASARPELEVELEFSDDIEDLTKHCVTDDDFIVALFVPPAALELKGVSLARRPSVR